MVQLYKEVRGCFAERWLVCGKAGLTSITVFFSTQKPLSLFLYLQVLNGRRSNFIQYVKQWPVT